MTRPDGTGPFRLWQNAAANQLYVYPAHKDYADEDGDLFPANTPYILVSRGSSGSDQPLPRRGGADPRRLPPRHQGDGSRSEHLAGADGADGVPPLAAERALARGLLQRRRPSGRLRGLRDQPRPHGAASPTRSSPTPSRRRSRIRVHRGGARHRGRRLLRRWASPSSSSTPPPPSPASGARAPDGAAMTVSAEETADPNGRAAQPSSGACCRATPSGCGSSPLERRRAAPGSPSTGTSPSRSPRTTRSSPPGSTSASSPTTACTTAPRRSSAWYFPPTEARSYAPGPDGAPRIAAHRLRRPGEGRAYADPMLIARADWRDDYPTPPDGSLLGWTRTAATAREDFDRRRAPASSPAPPTAGPAAHRAPSPTRSAALPDGRLDGRGDRRRRLPCPC